jgi:hypothetical protein
VFNGQFNLLENSSWKILAGRDDLRLLQGRWSQTEAESAKSVDIGSVTNEWNGRTNCGDYPA